GQLVGRQAGSVRRPHGVDEIVDERLDLWRRQLVGLDLPGALAQDRVTHGHDRTDRHRWSSAVGSGAAISRIGRRTPRSAATSRARGYPASAWRTTPMPGSAVSTRASFWAAR